MSKVECEIEKKKKLYRISLRAIPIGKLLCYYMTTSKTFCRSGFEPDIKG